MAAPTITALSPTAGHTGGRTLVEIEGSNFRTPTPQAVNARGYTPPPPPSVSVTFGGVPAREIRWFSPGELWVLSPITPNPGAGAVDVVVANIDDTGAPIPGESATLPLGYSYVLPTLTADNESDLARAVRAFLQEVKRQVTPNFTWPVATDYAPDGSGDLLSISKLARLPGLVVADFELRGNDFYAMPGMQYVRQGANAWVGLAPPDCVDLVFTIAGVSNDAVELLNLAASMRRFFKKNAYLELARDPNNAGAGAVRYEMDAYEDKDTRLKITSNADSLQSFTFVAIVRGFDIEAMSGLPLGGPAGVSEGATDAGFVDLVAQLEPTGKLAPPAPPYPRRE